MCRRLTAKLSAVATDNVRRSVPVGPRRICGGSADLLKLAWNANLIGPIFNRSICKEWNCGEKIELLCHTLRPQMARSRWSWHTNWWLLSNRYTGYNALFERISAIWRETVTRHSRLRMVPTFVHAHTFWTSRKMWFQISWGRSVAVTIISLWCQVQVKF